MRSRVHHAAEGPVLHGPLVRRLLAFFALAAGLQLILPVLQRSAFFAVYTQALAHGAAALLRLLGFDVQAAHSVIASRQFAVQIREGCDAVEPIAFFVFAVAVAPVPWRRRLSGMATGSVALLGLNLVRIASLYGVGLWNPRAFQRLHVEIWQPLFLLAAITTWLLWARWVTDSDSNLSHRAS